MAWLNRQNRSAFYRVNVSGTLWPGEGAGAVLQLLSCAGHNWLNQLRAVYLFFCLAGDVRLVDGPNAYSGRVEIYYAFEWGTICDISFNDDAAAVVCRQLGYTGGVAYSNAYYGQGSGTIWMDDVACSGTESSLTGCYFNGWGYGFCVHADDAGVKCNPPPATTAPTSSPQGKRPESTVGNSASIPWSWELPILLEKLLEKKGTGCECMHVLQTALALLA